MMTGTTPKPPLQTESSPPDPHRKIITFYNLQFEQNPYGGAETAALLA